MNSIHFEMSLGVRVWPSKENKQITTSSTGNTKLSLSSNTSSQLLIELDDGKEHRLFVTQRLSLPLNALFSIVVKFDVICDSISVFINNNIVLSATDSNEEMIIEGNAVTMPVIQLPDLTTLKGHTDDEIFFIRTLLDLAQRINSTEDYEILKISGLLRLLLIDVPCLIDLANANYRVRLRYTPVDIRLARHSHEGNEPVLMIYSILANSQQLALQTDVSRTSFIQTPCIKAHGTLITIVDVIHYCAHKIGGVHYDPSMPNKPSQANFGLLLETETLYGNRLYANILKDIAFLVIKAAIPLLEAIKNKQSE